MQYKYTREQAELHVTDAIAAFGLNEARGPLSYRKGHCRAGGLVAFSFVQSPSKRRDGTYGYARIRYAATMQTIYERAQMKGLEIEALINQVKSNCANGRFLYEGMTTAEIAAHNRYLMFGENDKAFNEPEFRAVTE